MLAVTFFKGALTLILEVKTAQNLYEHQHHIGRISFSQGIQVISEACDFCGV